MIRDYSLKNYFEVTSKSEKQVGYTNTTLIKGEKFNLRVFDDSNKIYDCNSIVIYKK